MEGVNEGVGKNQRVVGGVGKEQSTHGGVGKDQSDDGGAGKQQRIHGGVGKHQSVSGGVGKRQSVDGGVGEHQSHHLLAKTTQTTTEEEEEGEEGRQQREKAARNRWRRRNSKSSANSSNNKISRVEEEEVEDEICLMCKKTAPTHGEIDGFRKGGRETGLGTGGGVPMPANTSNARKFALNFVVIVGVALSWALAVQFRKSSMAIDPSHFYAPFSLTWFATAFMVICFPVFLLFAFVCGKNVRQERHNAFKVLRSAAHGHFSIRHSVLCPLLFLCLWTTINYAYAQSLGLISAGAASSIMSASTALVWVLSWILLREKFSALKFVAVLVAMAGVLLVALDNEFAANHLGICLAILATVIASFYKVLFKLCVGNASLGQVSLFMTVLGVQNLALNTGLSAVLLHLDWDHVEWDHVPWSPLIGSALLGLIFNFLVNFGIALLNPLVISIGMLFGMPLNACIDVLFRAMPISALFLVGSLLITFSFVLIIFPVELLDIRNIFCRTKKRMPKFDEKICANKLSADKKCFDDA